MAAQGPCKIDVEAMVQKFRELVERADWIVFEPPTRQDSDGGRWTSEVAMIEIGRTVKSPGR